MGAEDKERDGEVRENEGCCRLGMPGKRSAASSALPPDKLWERVAWINPLSSFLQRPIARSINGLQWGRNSQTEEVEALATLHREMTHSSV